MMPQRLTPDQVIELLNQRPPIKELNEALATLGNGRFKEIASLEKFFSKREDFLRAVKIYLRADIKFRKEVRSSLELLKKEDNLGKEKSGPLGVKDELVREIVEFVAKAAAKRPEEVFELVAKPLQLSPSSVKAKYNRPSTHKNKRGKEK